MEALRCTVDREVHLILLDVQMPEMDGYETARYLKMTDRTRAIPTIFLTAVFKAEEFVRQGYAVGAVDYLTKPIDDHQLLNRVQLYRHLHERERKLMGTLDLLHRQDEALAKALDLANAANLAKSAFLANMSHEIRTPMNAIIGLTHLALLTELTVQQRQYLERTQNAAGSLLGIINDILDFSKIEAGKLQMEKKAFQLEDVLEKATHLMSSKAAEKQLELILDVGSDVPEALLGDPLRLGQVLTNLYSNALKFSESGEVILRVRLVQTSGESARLQFSVRDSGIGMSAEQIQQLFLPFNQVDTLPSRRSTGTGLGLAICKHLVTMMEGEIWVQSEPDQGSEFFFTATFGLGAPQRAPQAIAGPGLAGLRILVVDDSPNSLAVIQAMATHLGFQAATVASAAEAMEALQREPYDLVMLDWRMPAMDGFEAARWIRSSPGLASAPRIIMMTAYGDEEMRDRVAAEGLDGFLSKPITASSLLDGIMSAFGRKAAFPLPEIKDEPFAPEDLARIRGAQVLLVEDNDYNQQVASELLARMGVQVTLAGNGGEAIAQVHSRHFAAVLMDLQMPGMDGFEATQQLRRDPAFASLPILAMTAHVMSQEREHCRSIGMNDYITKPICPRDLAATLARWLPPAVPVQDRLPPGPTGEGQLPADDPLPGIDQTVGLGYSAGQRALYETLLARFMTTRQGVTEEIRAALARGDTQSAVRAAHSMIAASGTIGALRLSASATALQDALTSDPNASAAQLESFRQALDLVIESLSSHFGGA
jgi:CheY-like chemotaxis protein/HPt (histidine-containing phosphotransfer) domain-containing protein